jgi:serine/threonine-protein kinase RsbW
LTAQYEGVTAACDFVAQAALLAGFGEGALFKLQLATDEAFTNIVEHAYGGETEHGRVLLSCWTDGGYFHIQLQDHGRAFDPPPDQLPLHPPTDLENPAVGGLGLHFIRQIMDDLTYQHDPQQGNRLIMRKRIPE